MSEVEAVSANNAVTEEKSQNDKGVKSRKSKSPRATVDSTKEESDAITKGISGEVEGRRITRSAAKGVTATPPPPAKKERKSAASKGRGRPKKGSHNATDESDSHDEGKDVTMTDAEAKSEDSKKDIQAVENNTHDEKEESANNNAEVSKEGEATQNGAKEDSVDASSSGDDKKEEKSETSTEDAASPATEAADKPAE